MKVPWDNIVGQVGGEARAKHFLVEQLPVRLSCPTRPPVLLQNYAGEQVRPNVQAGPLLPVKINPTFVA